VFPLDVLTNKLDRFLELWTPCFLMTLFGSAEEACFGQSSPYIYGGAAQFASDGMDAYPPHRRNGGLHIIVLNETFREDFKRMFWEDLATPALSSDGGAPFPGIYCHNHLYNFVSTRRSDWLKDCSADLGDVCPGFGDCMSVQEAAFRTENMLRLRRIHTAIDPDRLFDPPDGPGYNNDPMIRNPPPPPPEEGDGPEALPADEPVSAADAQEEEEPSDSSATAGQEEPSDSSATVSGRSAFSVVAAAAAVAAFFFKSRHQQGCEQSRRLLLLLLLLLNTSKERVW